MFSFFGLLSFFIVAVDYAVVCQLHLLLCLSLLYYFLCCRLPHGGCTDAHLNAIAVGQLAVVVFLLLSCLQLFGACSLPATDGLHCIALVALNELEIILT